MFTNSQLPQPWLIVIAPTAWQQFEDGVIYGAVATVLVFAIIFRPRRLRHGQDEAVKVQRGNLQGQEELQQLLNHRIVALKSSLSLCV